MLFTCTSLFPCHCVCQLFFKRKTEYESLHFYWRRVVGVLGSSLAWIVEGMGGGLDNVSWEWWYVLVIFWSSLTRHILELCLTNRKYFIFLCFRKLSVNNCWHFLCLDWVTTMVLLKTETKDHKSFVLLQTCAVFSMKPYSFFFTCSHRHT